MRFLFALAAIALALPGCEHFEALTDHKQVKGSGVLKTETRPLAAFSQVELAGSGEVVVKFGKGHQVIVTADDNVLPLITTEVTGGKLVIGSKGSYSTRKGIRCEVQLDKLDGLACPGSGSIRTAGVKSNALDVSLSGSGEVVANGEAAKVKVDLSGSGSADLNGLKSKSAEVSLSGSGEVKVHASDRLEASLSGSGQISYSGNPKSVQRSVSGSGEVVAR